jgi:hypothetical protein
LKKLDRVGFLTKKLETDPKFKRKYKHLQNYLEPYIGGSTGQEIFDMWLNSHFIGYDMFAAGQSYHNLTSPREGLFGSGYKYKSTFKLVKSLGDTFAPFNVLYEMEKQRERRNLHFVRACESHRNHDVNVYFPKKKHGGKIVGVEIECIVPVEKIVTMSGKPFDPSYQSAYGYIAEYIQTWTKAERVRYINITSDGSINGMKDRTEAGFEFRVLVDLDRGYDNIKKFCKFLNQIGTRVNASCGLHVHFDQRHLLNTPEEILKRADRLNNALFGLKFIVPKSRVENPQYSRLEPNYGRILRTYIEEKGLQSNYYNFPNGNRYSAINTTCLDGKGTIEVRLHSGTVSFTKIRNWIEICYNIMNNPNFDDKTFEGNALRTLEADDELNDVFIKFLNFSEDKEYLNYYIKDRYNNFKYVNNEGSEDEKRTALIPTEVAVSTINRFRTQAEERERARLAEETRRRTEIEERERQRRRESESYFNTHVSTQVSEERAARMREAARMHQQILRDFSYVFDVPTPSSQPRVVASVDFDTGTVTTGNQLRPVAAPPPAPEPEDNSILGLYRRVQANRRRVYDTEAREEEE